MEKAFQKSFDNLNLGYIDLFLLHFPVSAKRVLIKDDLPADDVNSYQVFPFDKNGKIMESDADYVDTWRAMEKLVESKRVRSIGLSNFNSQQIDRIYTAATIKPVNNQIECHPNLNQRKLIDFCMKRNMTVTAYSPLGRTNTQQTAGMKLAIIDPKVLGIAKNHKKTPAQIILRYLVNEYFFVEIIIGQNVSKQLS